MKTKSLKRTRQCAKCPWKKGVNPNDIPNGYCETKHKGLAGTIADPSDPMSSMRGDLEVMACHETDEAHCVGWLHNQLGEGNNIGLRLKMMSYKNAGELKVVGEQHATFEDTLPDDSAGYVPAAGDSRQLLIDQISGKE